MIRWVAIALLAATAVLPAQVSPDKGERSRKILAKARHIDLLNHLLPLVLTKEQINKILVVLEKCRAKEDDISNREADQLRAVELKIDEALDKGIKGGVVPSKDLLRELNSVFISFEMRRRAASEENADDILAVLKTTLNAGQLKAAANSVDPKAYDPGVDVAKLTDDERAKYFIRAVMLDWFTYDLLVKLAAAR
jgi:hypothetical protein